MKKSVKYKKPIENNNSEVTIKQFELKDSYVILFFAVITFLFFREIILQQKFLWEDFMSYYYPVRNFATVTLSKGLLPFWNPYTFGGMPFIADIQTAVFYPLHLLLTIFVTDDKLPFAAFTYFFIFHYFMAGVFSYYLARSLDLNKWASILSGITFMFCGFMITHAVHETIILPLTYMPLAFMFYNKSLNTNKLKYLLLTGLFMGIIVLCGHPQITLYIFFMFLLFGLYQIFFKLKENSYKINASLFKFIVIVAFPFILGLMLGAIQLLPTMKLAELSIRSEISYEQSLEGSLNYHNLITLFSPQFFGTLNATKEGVLYWGGYIKGDGNQHLYLESCVYVGLPALIFGIFGIIALWKKKTVKFLAVILLLSIFLMLGDNFILYKLFYNFVPGFDNFRLIGRFGLVLAFCFSLLGAYGFDYFINNTENEKVKKFIKYLTILVSGFIIIMLLFQNGFFNNLVDVYQNEKVYDHSTTQVIKTTVTLLFLIAFVILFKKNIIPKQLIFLLFILLSFVDLYIFGAKQNNSLYSPEHYYVNPAIATKIKEEYKNELYRVRTRTQENSRIHIFERNQGMLDFIFMIDGYNQLTLKDKLPPSRIDELMNVKHFAIFDAVNNQAKFKFNENYMPRIWMSYYPIVESSLENVAKILKDTTFDITAKVIIDKEPKITIDIDSVNLGKYEMNIKSYQNNEIILEVGTIQNGVLILSEVYYPNWKVFVDGVEKPMLRCDYSLRGVALERGIHTVVFKYVDKDFQLGATITLFALAIVVGGFIVSRYKKVV